MNVLDLFSGIGGFSLGLEKAGFKTVAFCEIDTYCQKVLKKHWPNVPIYNDIYDLNIDRLREGGIDDIGLVCGGFPCQPFSVAGKQRGEEDDRYEWPEMYRVIKAVKPRWVIAENVAGLVNMGIDSVLSDLESAGFKTWTFIIPACAVDASHRRDRVWIVGNAERDGLSTPEIERSIAAVSNYATQGEKQTVESQGTSRREYNANVADCIKSGLEGHAGDEQDRSEPGRIDTQTRRPTGEGGLFTGRYTEWEPEPDVGRVAHGVPDRMDRLKGLGNAVVPPIVYILGLAIMACENS